MAAPGYPPSATGSNAMFYDSSNQHNFPPDPQEKTPLPRSISMADLSVTARCRGYVQNDWCMDAPHGGTNFFTSTPYFTLTLPPLDEYPPDFKEFAFNRIINRNTQQSLEDEKCLNWCPATTKLVPLYTLADGNCLLHAASLAMWGFIDRDYILRRAVSHAVTNCNNNTLCQRWKHTKDMYNEQYSIQLEPHQWEAEWGEIVRQASAEAAPGKSLEGLEEFHVFVLANILRRPIIMYAVPKMRSYAGSTLQRVNFHGIYLPLLWDKTACKKDPLPIAFYGGHFSALVVIEFPKQYWNGNLVFPLVDYFGQQLPVRFTLPQEDQTALMMDYLDIVQITSKCSPYISSSNVICAKLAVQETPAYLKPLLKGFFDACFNTYKANTGYQPQQQPHGNLESVHVEKTKVMFQVRPKGKNERKCGYDCEFVKPPPPELPSECLICLQVLREPHITSCCGHNFCEACIGYIVKDKKPCPLCQEHDFTTMANKGLKRTLNGFKVHCTHHDFGCEWVGELGDLNQHLNTSPQAKDRHKGCHFSELKCIYCKDYVRRLVITIHQAKHCPKRPYICDYCNDYKSTYSDVVNNHYAVCQHCLLPCPNNCNPLGIECRNLDHHLKDECPLTMVECELRYAGCEVNLLRKDMAEHMNKYSVAHISMLIQQMHQMQQTIQQLSQQNSELRSQVQDLTKLVCKK